MAKSALQTPKALASTTFPALARFLLLNIEPLLALSGVYLALTDPSSYVATLTRHAIPRIDGGTGFIYTELAGGWLFFAFVEAVVLRMVDDARVWRLLAAGMLLSDVAYCHSCAQALGGWRVWIDVLEWTSDDWTVTLTTWPFVLSRLAIVLGIGSK